MYVERIWSPIVIALGQSNFFSLLDSMGLGNFLVTETSLLHRSIRTVCYHAPTLCWAVISLITGRNLE